MSPVFTQYVIINRQIKESFPLGAVITQAVHSAVNVLYRYRDRNEVQEYMAQEPGHQHTVVLEASSSEELFKIKSKLHGLDVESVVFVEQPENFATALATLPVLKERTKPVLKRYRLCQ
ncbi:hypothetical protein P9112_008938 [Eukaryota sp. TZLM1-RC]